MLSFLSSKFINNIVSREVTITEEFYPYSGERRIIVRMYKQPFMRKIFTRVYVPLTRSDFHKLYYDLLLAYCSCSCKAPKDFEKYRVR